MMTANAKRKLHSGQVSLGAWLYLNSPSAAELMARAGFDWLIIDGEHGAASWDAMQTQLQAMNGSPTVPILRVAWNDPVRGRIRDSPRRHGGRGGGTNHRDAKRTD